MQSLNVPCWPGVLPWLRGTISYHAPKRARGRSAISGNSCDRVRSGRNWLSAIAVLEFVGQQRCGIAGLQIILAMLQDHGSGGLAAGLRLGRAGRRPRWHRAPGRRRPSASAQIRGARWRTRRSRPRWHRHGGPADPARTSPPQRSLLCMVIGSRRHSRSRSRRQTSAAATTSWPSR